MSRSTRDEYFEKMRCHYRRYTRKPATGRLLDEFDQVIAHNRMYAAKLTATRCQSCAGTGGALSWGERPPTYDAEVAGVLFVIWRRSEQPCGKRLRPILGLWLPFYERRYETLPAKVRNRGEAAFIEILHRLRIVHRVTIPVQAPLPRIPPSEAAPQTI